MLWFDGRRTLLSLGGLLGGLRCLGELLDKLPQVVQHLVLLVVVESTLHRRLHRVHLGVGDGHALGLGRHLELSLERILLHVD